MTTIKTSRLNLRLWKKDDFELFAKLNQDPRVTEFFAKMPTPEESYAFAKSKQDHLVKYGWGLWAASLTANGEFIGFIGLNEDKELFKEPVVEIGWRLAFDYWGMGYATEGARAVLDYGFKDLGLSKIFSWTTETNMRSRSVMEKIGLKHDPKNDFDHPKLSKDHLLKRHVLYSITKELWKNLHSYL